MRTSSGSTRRCRSEEHTSELQSRLHLVCRLLLEKKKKHRSCRSYSFFFVRSSFDHSLRRRHTVFALPAPVSGFHATLGDAAGLAPFAVAFGELHCRRRQRQHIPSRSARNLRHYYPSSPHHLVSTKPAYAANAQAPNEILPRQRTDSESIPSSFF